MASVREDIIRGSGARLTTRGWEFNRVFIVSGLTTIGSMKYVEAVAATNIPYGASHPAISTAFAVEFVPEQIESSNDIAVNILYREFAQDYVIDLGSRPLMRPRTDYYYYADNDPIPMKLWYTYPTDYTINEKMQGKTESQGVEVQVQEEFPTITISRTEFTSIAADNLSGYPAGAKLTGEMLTDRGLKFNGFLNAPGWDLRPTDLVNTWRCIIRSRSAEDGLAYRVTYDFSYDPNQWRAPAAFKDPFSGEPVPDPERVVTRPDPLPEDWPSDDKAALNLFSVFKQQDFSLLELPY